ncbi:MAG: BolA/IbaG family iron-sulfur metabolism protein [Alphaproteobacteria bacterium]
MAMESKDILLLLEKAFSDAEITLKDLKGDQDHYLLQIKSASFQGKNRVQQHQLVYAALKDKIGTDLHALALQTEPK